VTLRLQAQTHNTPHMVHSRSANRKYDIYPNSETFRGREYKRR